MRLDAGREDNLRRTCFEASTKGMEKLDMTPDMYVREAPSVSGLNLGQLVQNAQKTYEAS